MSQPALANLPERPPVSAWRAALRVLTDPGETFSKLGAKPPIFPPYLIHMAVGAIAFAVSIPALLEASAQAMSLAASQPGVEMDPSMMGAMSWVSVGFAGVTQIAGPWLAGMLLSFVATFFGQFQGGGVSLSAYLGMIGYARLPLAISTLLGGVFAAFTGQSLDLSLAVFLPETASGVMVGLLKMINPFGIWYYVLLATGFAALFGRSPKRGWLLPVALFVAGTLVTIGTSGFGAAAAPMQ